MKSNKSKYKLVVDYVIDGINEGRLKKGAYGYLLLMNLEKCTACLVILFFPEYEN
ncbi:hypothetical protein NXY15_29585 [Bacteroides thetaiotaomicron]|nr:hypothetical protein NXY15_29585 [Bacteroides thetaiotaomicron]